MKNKIVILTGPPGAGKSTVGDILAKRIKNSAKVSTDALRDFIRNGRAGKGDKDWEKQLNDAAKNGCMLTENFYKAGFNVFLDDVICIPERMNTYQKNLSKCNPTIILLLPSKEVVAKRDLEREKWAMKERAIYLHSVFEKFVETEKRFVIIDSSNQTAEETAEEIRKIVGL